MKNSEYLYNYSKVSLDSMVLKGSGWKPIEYIMNLEREFDCILPDDYRKFMKMFPYACIFDDEEPPSTPLGISIHTCERMSGISLNFFLGDSVEREFEIIYMTNKEFNLDVERFSKVKGRYILIAEGTEGTPIYLSIRGKDYGHVVTFDIWEIDKIGAEFAQKCIIPIAESFSAFVNSLTREDILS